VAALPAVFQSERQVSQTHGSRAACDPSACLYGRLFNIILITEHNPAFFLCFADRASQYIYLSN